MKDLGHKKDRKADEDFAARKINPLLLSRRNGFETILARLVRKPLSR
jgi:hypothetical protein